MSTEKVSIIIPVYNVAQYLDKCMESVLSQSYHNTEVLLVDDGSTDGSGALCDGWAKKDPRIEVLHKKNGGLSDARNAGLDAAHGEYLVFVDSDDYIADDMVQKLYDALKKNNADMSICNICYVDEQGALLEDDNRDSPLRDEVLSGHEIIVKECDCYHKGWYYIFTVNKLYKKSLFSEIRFPVGKLSEDDFVAHRIFMRCKRVACISDVGYYYVQRSGSILHKRSVLLFVHQAEGRLERAAVCSELGLTRSAGLTYWQAAMALPEAFRRGNCSPETLDKRNEVLLRLRNEYWLRKYCTAKEKMQVLLVYLSPRVYRVIFRNSFRKQMKKSLKAALR